MLDKVHFLIKIETKKEKKKKRKKRQMRRLVTKPTQWHVRPAKIQISLGIRPDWSEVSLCAQWVSKDPSFLHADGEYSDQTGRMPRLIWVFAGCTCHFVGFVVRRLKWTADVKSLAANALKRKPLCNYSWTVTTQAILIIQNCKMRVASLVLLYEWLTFPKFNTWTNH